MKAIVTRRMIRWSLLGVFMFLCLIFGCAHLPGAPSVCDDIKGRSLLCQMSEQSGVALEDIGNAFVIANAVAIGEGLYTKDQALDVMQEFLRFLEAPVSYVFVRNTVKQYTDKYPGLLVVSQMYVDRFISGRIMYKDDQEILKAWLAKQVKTLSS